MMSRAAAVNCEQLLISLDGTHRTTTPVNGTTTP